MIAVVGRSPAANRTTLPESSISSIDNFCVLTYRDSTHYDDPISRTRIFFPVFWLHQAGGPGV